MRLQMKSRLAGCLVVAMAVLWVTFWLAVVGGLFALGYRLFQWLGR